MQNKRQKMLIVTTEHPHDILASFEDHGFDATKTVRQVTHSDLRDSGFQRRLANEIVGLEGLVLLEDGLHALQIHCLLPHKHRGRLIIMTDRQPMQLPMPAINLKTGHHNFN